MITQTEKINGLLNKIRNVNSKKLLLLKQYSENWFLLHITMKESNLKVRFKDFPFQDGLILQHVIENKNQIINQYSMELGRN